VSIILVRHTRPAVERNVCYGRTDLKLPDSFAEDARRVLDKLQSSDILITSPLHRCRRLAAKIAAEFGMEQKIDDRVREMDFGSWEGRPWSEIPSSELDQWAHDFLHARPHGGESVAMLRERSLNAINEFRRVGRRHIVVTHSGVIKATLSDGDTADSFAAVVEFGGIVELPTQKELIDDRR